MVDGLFCNEEAINCKLLNDELLCVDDELVFVVLVFLDDGEFVLMSFKLRWDVLRFANTMAKCVRLWSKFDPSI